MFKKLQICKCTANNPNNIVLTAMVKVTILLVSLFLGAYICTIISQFCTKYLNYVLMGQ